MQGSFIFRKCEILWTLSSPKIHLQTKKNNLGGTRTPFGGTGPPPAKICKGNPEISIDEGQT